LIRFQLARLSKDDLLLSRGSNIPTMDTAADAPRPLDAFRRSATAGLADLVLIAGNGVTAA
jgi:hypothetical protein